MQDVINGLYGFLYNENGKEMSTTQEAEANVEFEKVDVKQAGKFMVGKKVVGGSGTGSFTYLKVTSELQKKIAENPTAKYNYIMKLADPTVNGEEAVLLKGVSFDAVPLAAYSLGELVEVSLDFTFEDYQYLDNI